MISIACLIFKSAKFADAVYASLHEHTPDLHNGNARFFFVANDASHALKEHLHKKQYPFVCQENQNLSIHTLQNMGYAPPDYIHRVYRGWNRAIKESDETLVLINSDMIFSSGWLDGLKLNFSPEKIITSTLVERWQDRFGSRETGPKYFVEADFGDHPDRFRYDAWNQFAKSIKKSILNPGRHFASVMMNRSKAYQAGLYPEGNLFSPWGIYSGDRAFFARMQSFSVDHLESQNSIVYHFNEGEQNDIGIE